MLQMRAYREEGGEWMMYPVASCDLCGKPMKSVEALAVYELSGEGNAFEVWTIHKDCDERLRRRAGVVLAWRPLLQYLEELTWNLAKADIDSMNAEVPPVQAERSAPRLGAKLFGWTPEDMKGE